MSNLKHQTPEELRKTLEWCKACKDEHKAFWLYKEKQAHNLLEEVMEHRRLWHNIGQKEAWARKYLAEKT